MESPPAPATDPIPVRVGTIPVVVHGNPTPKTIRGEEWVTLIVTTGRLIKTR